MPVKVIALVTINEDQPLALAQYLEATLPLLAKVGGKLLQRFVVQEAVVGQKPAQSVMIVEYPDHAAVDALFGSQTYKDIIPIRDVAFSTYSVSIAAMEEEVA